MKTYVLPYDAMLKLKEMPPISDRKTVAILRLKRWKARAWMKEQGIVDLGRTVKLQRINQ